MLINTSDEFVDEFKELIGMTQPATTETINSVTNETLNQMIELKNFKQEGADGIVRCKIRFIILPLLTDHVLREANHYVRLLKFINKNKHKNRSLYA